MHLLITGGTGTLGTHVVQHLMPLGHDVSVLTRRSALPTALGTCRARTGNLATGEGLATALEGVDAVIHCASNPKDLRAHVDVRGTQNLVQAAQAGSSPHITYISIVGCDQIPVPYYKAKHRAEQIIAGSGLPWSILRATQFHDLLFGVLKACSKPPAAIVPKGFQFQPVNAGEVADQLIAITTESRTGRQPDFGGPHRADIRHWMRLFLAATGSSKRVVEAPVPGRIGAAFRAGRNTVTTGDRGAATFEEFLVAG